ncbi:hypothetical protein [Coleofasciculus sp. FACHB-SPT9]|uniref:hypothetical protein n=1 Tax=Cyanophyceae TaxID=3028117 RepID=UPI0016856C07|nr:hypothetical protein [Coleofasciculus sp. FACHB-SPT9]MBD1892687.1 hypothetical protein [Coleofasciculus sp. FACHB-SPT9]
MITRFFLSKPGWDSDPEHNPRPDICRAKKSFAEGQSFIVTWTCAKIGIIQVGDRAYFKRVGKEPRGFFAYGLVIPARYQLCRNDNNYSKLSEAYNKKKYNDFTVDIEWIEVVDYDRPLKTTDLKNNPKFKGARLNPQTSGMNLLQEEYVDLLDCEWKKHLEELIKQGDGSRKKTDLCSEGINW